MKQTLCVYHSRDLDGWMSAAIVEKYFIENAHSEPLINFLPWDYGDPIPDFKDYDKIIMVDISFAPDIMIPIYTILGKELIWCDHHISAINQMQKVILDKADIGLPEGLRRTDYSACELTWMFFFPSDPMPEIVRRLGRYDSFQHKGTPEEEDILRFQFGARQVIHNREDALRFLNICNEEMKSSHGTHNLDSIYHIGTYVYDYLCSEAQNIYGRRFDLKFLEPVTESHGKAITTTYIPRKFLAVNAARFNPINFKIDYHKDEYDGAACFHFEKGAWVFSLYNENGLVDCSEICKTFGGGGHKGAAGFRTDDILRFTENLTECK